MGMFFVVLFLGELEFQIYQINSLQMPLECLIKHMSLPYCFLSQLHEIRFKSKYSLPFETFFLCKKISKMSTEKDIVIYDDSKEQPKEKVDPEAAQAEAYNPETGEINWDCPCLGTGCLT